MTTTAQDNRLQNTERSAPGLNSPQYDLTVSVGTDHHEFNRLLTWVHEYLDAHPKVSALIQHGSTPPVPSAECVQRMPREQLLDCFRHSSVVLVQGGPGSILDARSVGALPLAVPRRSDMEEAVDDHQIPFTRAMAQTGEAVMVQGREELFLWLDRALAEPVSFRTHPRISESHRSAQELEYHIEKMLTSRRGVRPGRAFRRILRQAQAVLRPLLPSAGNGVAGNGGPQPHRPPFQGGTST